MVNTLASSDYGLLDEETYEPRPDFYAAVLWKRLMGQQVLGPGITLSGNTRIYAQCERDHKGGVTLLVLNANSTAEQTITLPAGERYTLSSPSLESQTTLLNGKELATINDSLPAMPGQKTTAGKLTFAPQTVTFVTLPTANNPACR